MSLLMHIFSLFVKIIKNLEEFLKYYLCEGKWLIFTVKVSLNISSLLNPVHDLYMTSVTKV